MIGPKVGARVRPRVRPVVGMGRLGAAAAIAGVTRDAASGIYFPANQAEWTLMMAAAGLATGNPSLVWNHQDASGNPAEADGGVALVVENAAGISYQNAVAGFTRKALNTTSGTAGLVRTTDAGLPDLATTSQLLLGVVKPTTIANTRDLLLMGTTATRVAAKNLLTTGFIQAICVGNTLDGVVNEGGVVTPLALRLNRNNSTCGVFTKDEKLAVTFAGTVAGKSVAYGNLMSGCATCQYLYLVSFHGAAAQLSDAQLKTLLTALGWSIAWT